jgi:putative addiction module component (TIGR02574 family)
MRTADDILKEALALNEAERARVADALIRSIEPQASASEVEEAWRQEVRRRMAAREAGEEGTVPWSEVRDALYARLRAHSG